MFIAVEPVGMYRQIYTVLIEPEQGKCSMANITELVSNVNEGSLRGKQARIQSGFFDSLRGECYHEQRDEPDMQESNP
jgi:hypothetical protein